MIGGILVPFLPEIADRTGGPARPFDKLRVRGKLIQSLVKFGVTLNLSKSCAGPPVRSAAFLRFKYTWSFYKKTLNVLITRHFLYPSLMATSFKISSQKLLNAFQRVR